MFNKGTGDNIGRVCIYPSYHNGIKWFTSNANCKWIRKFYHGTNFSLVRLE